MCECVCGGGGGAACRGKCFVADVYLLVERGSQAGRREGCCTTVRECEDA
jgi:hypothetical protein